METKGGEDIKSYDSKPTIQESWLKRERRNAITDSHSEKQSISSLMDMLTENVKSDVQPVVAKSISTLESYNTSSNTPSSMDDVFENDSTKDQLYRSDSTNEQNSTSLPSEKSKTEPFNDLARKNAIIEQFFNNEGRAGEPLPVIIVPSKRKFCLTGDSLPSISDMQNMSFKRNPFLKYASYGSFNSPPAEDRIQVGCYQRTSIPPGPPGYVPCSMPKLPPPSYGAVAKEENVLRPGMCPACKIGLLKEEYSYAMLICFCCYPLSCGKYKKCENCSTYF